MNTKKKNHPKGECLYFLTGQRPCSMYSGSCANEQPSRPKMPQYHLYQRSLNIKQKLNGSPTCICVFPPWRRAIPSRMLSSNTRSFLVLTIRSMTSSDVPTLSKRHWISTMLLPGLSQSSMAEAPAHIKERAAVIEARRHLVLCVTRSICSVDLQMMASQSLQTSCFHCQSLTWKQSFDSQSSAGAVSFATRSPVENIKVILNPHESLRESAEFGQ